MEGLWKKQSSLQEFVGADQFKSYEDLKKRLGYVLGNKTSARPTFDEDLEDLSEKVQTRQNKLLLTQFLQLPHQ